MVSELASFFEHQSALVAVKRVGALVRIDMKEQSAFLIEGSRTLGALVDQVEVPGRRVELVALHKVFRDGLLWVPK